MVVQIGAVDGTRAVVHDGGLRRSRLRHRARAGRRQGRGDQLKGFGAFIERDGTILLAGDPDAHIEGALATRVRRRSGLVAADAVPGVRHPSAAVIRIIDAGCVEVQGGRAIVQQQADLEPAGGHHGEHGIGRGLVDRAAGRDRDRRVPVQRGTRVGGAGGVVRVVRPCAIIKDDRSARGADTTGVGGDQAEVLGAFIDTVIHDRGAHEQRATCGNGDGRAVGGPQAREGVEVLEVGAEVRTEEAGVGKAVLQGQGNRLSSHPGDLEHRERRAFVDEDVVDLQRSIVIGHVAGGIQLAARRDCAIVDGPLPIIADGRVCGVRDAGHVAGGQAQGFGTFGQAVLQDRGTHEQLARSLDGWDAHRVGVGLPGTAVVVLQRGQDIAAHGGSAVRGAARQGQCDRLADLARHREIHVRRSLVDHRAGDRGRGTQGDGVVVGVEQAAGVGGPHMQGVGAAGARVGGVHEGGQHRIDVGLCAAQRQAGGAGSGYATRPPCVGRQGTLRDAQSHAGEIAVAVTDRQGRDGQRGAGVHQQAGRQGVDRRGVACADGDRQRGGAHASTGVLGFVGEGVDTAIGRARIGRVAVVAVLKQRQRAVGAGEGLAGRRVVLQVGGRGSAAVGAAQLDQAIAAQVRDRGDGGARRDARATDGQATGQAAGSVGDSDVAGADAGDRVNRARGDALHRTRRDGDALAAAQGQRQTIAQHDGPHVGRAPRAHGHDPDGVGRDARAVDRDGVARGGFQTGLEGDHQRGVRGALAGEIHGRRSDRNGCAAQRGARAGPGHRQRRIHPVRVAVVGQHIARHRQADRLGHDVAVGDGIGRLIGGQVGDHRQCVGAAAPVGAIADLEGQAVAATGVAQMTCGNGRGADAIARLHGHP